MELLASIPDFYEAVSKTSEEFKWVAYFLSPSAAATEDNDRGRPDLVFWIQKRPPAAAEGEEAASSSSSQLDEIKFKDDLPTLGPKELVEVRIHRRVR